MNYTILKYGLCLLILCLFCFGKAYAQAGAPSFSNYGGVTQLTFNNADIFTTEPVFRISTASGSAPDLFTIEINTLSTFTGTSWIDSFPGTYVVDTAYDLTFTNGFTPVAGTTYYVRSRASADNGTTWSGYSSGTYSFTYETGGNPYWYQDMQPQWMTDSLVNDSATTANNIQLVAGTGGGTNPFANPSFESQGTSWASSVYQADGINTSHFIGYATSSTNSINGFPFTPPSPSPVTNGTYCLVMCNDADGFSEGSASGYYIVAQKSVNLTGITSISFSQTFSDWNQGGCQGGVYSESNLYVYIDPNNSTTGTAGNLVYTSSTLTGACSSGTVSYGPTTETINLPAGTYGSNCSVKFAFYSSTGAYSTFTDAPTCYIDNIQTSTGGYSPGVVASTPIYLASVQGATNWGILKWNQNLYGGSIKLEVKKLVSGVWTDAAGLNDISSSTDGSNEYDISSLGATGVDSIRIFATLTATADTSPTLNSWAVEEITPPVLAPTANGNAVADTECSGATVVLAANATLPAFNNCTGNWQYAWSNGTNYWNGTAFAATSPVYNISYDTITVTSVTAGATYTAIVNCSASLDAADTGKVSVSIYQPPSVTLSPSHNNVCTGTPVTFTATATNAGANPSYDFYLDGNSVQNSSSNTYSTGSLNNDDSVWVVVTSGILCVPALTTTSAKIHMTILPKIFSTIIDTICYSQTYGGHGATGTYVDTFTASNGCDSIRTLQLTVSPLIESTVSETICYGQTYGGHGATGTYVDTLTAKNGCDSVRTLNLTVSPLIDTTISQTVCYGQTYDGYNTTGTYVDTLKALNGCDSIRTLNLTVSPLIDTSILQTVCYGQTYDGYNATGTYVDTLKALNGCDSIRIIYLIVSPLINTTISQTICNGQTYDGYNATGIYMDTLTALNGCDSIRTLNLTVVPLIETAISQTLCYGQAYDGYDTTGTYIDTFTASGGCDSIRTLQLVVLPLINSTVSQTICYNQTYGGHDTTGTYVDTLTAMDGCDSIRILNLTVLPLIDTTISQTICNGKSDEGYDSTGIYVDTLVAANGCDSIRTINLMVEPLITATVNLNICVGSNYEGYSEPGTYVDTFIAYNGCDSIRTLNLALLPNTVDTIYETICYGSNYSGYNTSGVYVDTFPSYNGCDSIRTLYLTISALIQTTSKVVICQGDTVNGHTSAGNYTDTLQALNGCDSIVTLELTVIPTPAVPIISQYGDTLVASVTDVSYQWYLSGYELFADTTQQIIATASGAYSVIVGDTDGCKNISSNDTVVLTGIAAITSAPECRIFPNPASDVINIELKSMEQNQALTLRIFDVTGKAELNKTFTASGNDYNLQLSLANLAEGLYLIQVTQGDWTANQRIVIAR